MAELEAAEASAMQKYFGCGNPEHARQTVVDVVAQEVICIGCGGIRLEDQSNELRQTLSSAQERETTSTDHYRSNSNLMVRNGSQMGYVSARSPGDVFRLANPFGGKDAQHKHTEPVITPGVGYQIAKSFGRNGYWEGLEFIITYERDSWYASASQHRMDLCSRYGIDELTADRLARKDLQGYSKVIIDIMPELVSRLSINMMPLGRLRRDHREENRAEVITLLTRLSDILSQMLDKGDRIADTEDGFEIEEPLEEHDPKKRVSIMAGNEQYLDEMLDVGKI